MRGRFLAFQGQDFSGYMRPIGFNVRLTVVGHLGFIKDGRLFSDA